MLPLFCDGIREKDDPYRILAVQGLRPVSSSRLPISPRPTQQQQGQQQQQHISSSSSSSTAAAAAATAAVPVAVAAQQQQQQKHLQFHQ
ncbi:hypothetical protein Emed_004721 [Eimeria media]